MEDGGCALPSSILYPPSSLPCSSFILHPSSFLDRHVDQVIRHFDKGMPIIPLDSLTRPEYIPEPPPIDVELATIDFASKTKKSVFAPKDQMQIVVTNKSDRDIYVEMISTSINGEKVIQLPGTTRVKARDSLRLPKDKAAIIGEQLGKEYITIFACDTATFAGEAEFPAGTLLKDKDVGDRVVHPYYGLRRNRQQVTVRFDPANMVKKTIEIETR